MGFKAAALGIDEEYLPTEWKLKRIDSLAFLNPEQVNAVYPYSQILYLDIANVSAGSYGEPENLPLSDAPNRAKRVVRTKDTIISTVRPGNRAYVYVRNAPDNLVASTGFAVVRAKTDTEPRFVYYLLTSSPIINYLSSIAEEKTAYPSVNPEDIAECIVPVPPLPEQRALAHILGPLDDKIELNRRMSETLEAMARALFKSWFVDFDPVRAKMEGRWKQGESLPGLPADLWEVFPDRLVDSELGEIPEGWRETCVDDEFDVTMGQSPPGKTYNLTGEGMPFYQGRSDFQSRFPNRRVYCTAPTRLAKLGDTLISVRAPVGDINMAGEHCAIGRGVAAARHKSGSRSYTYQFMRGLETVFARFEAEGTVFGSIGKADFHAIKCIAPSSQVVSAFDGVLAQMDDRIEITAIESHTLSSLRDTLLPKLISGKIRVRDADKFVERAV